ncbi:hypothetical protein BGZ72_004593 [Mortierella alpina]|nr:hypothetical protein BGZ72_004593 [Mortierella alpina]
MFRYSSQGGHQYLGITLSMLQGKTNREGKENYCMASWFDPGDLPFDDPNWFKLHLMPGKYAFKEITSGAHYATVKALFDAAEVVSKKRTHVARGTGSRHAQDAGADIASIENHGGWGKGRVSTHYLSRISDDVPSKMAGFTLPGERLRLARGTFYRQLHFRGCYFLLSRTLPSEPKALRIGSNGPKT